MDNKDKIIREQREEIRLLSEALAAALFLAGCGQTSGSGNEPEYEIEVQTEETDEETEIMTMNVQVGDAINSQTITQAGDIVLYQGNQSVMFYVSKFLELCTDQTYRRFDRLGRSAGEMAV